MPEIDPMLLTIGRGLLILAAGLAVGLLAFALIERIDRRRSG